MLLCMRTTLDINDALLIAAKQRAARQNQTLTALVEEALRKLLNPSRAQPAREVPIFRGGHVQPGVDLSSNASMLEAMEKSDGKPGR